MKNSLSFLSSKVRLILAALALCAQSACGSVPPTTSIYKTPSLSDAQWSRIQEECVYEAKKATASASTKTIVAYRRFELFNMCAKLKGATYVGDVTMPDEKLRPIWDHCKAEAKSAVAGRPASHQREEMQEDLEIECMKGKGIVFHPSRLL